MTSFPAIHQDLAVVVDADVGRGGGSRGGARRRGGELLRSAEVFDLYEGEQLGTGRKSLALRLEFRAADRTLTDEEVAELRAAIEAALAPDRGTRSVGETPPQPLVGDPAARVLVAGASGFTGALAAQLVWEHPRLELVAATSRSDAGRRLEELYPRYRVPIELTELDLDALEGVDAAIVAYPHGASAPTVAALRGARRACRRPLRRFPPARPAHLRALVRGARRPELLEGAVYGLTELYRDELREAELVATPGCYPTASVLALAPLAEQGHARARSSIAAMQGTSGYGRSSDDTVHFTRDDRERLPL